MQDLLNHIFLRRVEREADELEPLSIQPIYRPFAPMIETVKNLSARPGPVVYRANNCTGAFLAGFLTAPER